MMKPLALAVAALLLLAGCSAPSIAEGPSIPSTATPTPAPTREGEPIGTQSAALSSVRVAVPPTRVQAPSAGIDVTVVPVGVQPDGFMELPPDVSIAGWYRFGSDPGSEAGTTVISAHVDSLEYGLGPFSALRSLAGGTVISVTSSDGSVRDYVVESVQSLAKDDLPVDHVFDREGSPRLVLITCGGQFDREQLRYSDNIMVTAVPVP
ncbi:hypothetical protein M2152_000842 [Microbacteriaceae bacterium SG_E_30_P1]|uniref:Sortase family protein n=1 Tax=Antiquaquibacter oligotrophicus TaxID=2880260 RepID=A0ABT6KKW5_9MICO|nr:class F sortase [Antiquaquibacter oligotrophicus]MDH6180660.1 hypothetical protein [Antiquaquibacter oligotrophicus]UDF13612.1 class F sortase [Antiquaquibacter oligotrophicus]